MVPHFLSMVGATTIHIGTNVSTDVPKTGVVVGRQSNKEQNPRKRKKSVLEEIVRTGGLQVISSVPKNPIEPT